MVSLKTLSSLVPFLHRSPFFVTSVLNNFCSARYFEHLCDISHPTVHHRTPQPMDSFSTFDLSAFEPTSSLPISSAYHSEDDDILRQLVDEDTKMGYAGYCVIA